MELNHHFGVKPLRHIRLMLQLMLLTVGLCAFGGCGGDSETGAEFGKGSLLPSAQNEGQAVDSTDSAALMANGATSDSTITAMPSLAAVPSEKSSTSAQVPQTADQKMKQSAPAKSSTAVAEGDYSVQVGSFRSQDNALALVVRVTEMGYRPEVEVASLGGQTYHRVIVNGLHSQQEAERCGEHIRSQEGITYLIRRR